MIYELRIYRCVPGRKPALLSRFENETLRIWEKHGIRQAGFWTTLIGKSSQEITYMLAWDSMAEREKRWGAFLADPEWVAVVAKTEKAGNLVFQSISGVQRLSGSRAVGCAHDSVVAESRELTLGLPAYVIRAGFDSHRLPVGAKLTVQ